jgi:hypothetical protein
MMVNLDGVSAKVADETTENGQTHHLYIGLEYSRSE